jgi:hypothetical protein
MSYPNSFDFFKSGQYFSRYDCELMIIQNSNLIIKIAVSHAVQYCNKKIVDAAC